MYPAQLRGSGIFVEHRAKKNLKPRRGGIFHSYGVGSFWLAAFYKDVAPDGALDEVRRKTVTVGCGRAQD